MRDYVDFYEAQKTSSSPTRMPRLQHFEPMGPTVPSCTQIMHSESQQTVPRSSEQQFLRHKWVQLKNPTTYQDKIIGCMYLVGKKGRWMSEASGRGCRNSINRRERSMKGLCWNLPRFLPIYTDLVQTSLHLQPRLHLLPSDSSSTFGSASDPLVF